MWFWFALLLWWVMLSSFSVSLSNLYIFFGLFFWVVFVAEYWDTWAACIFWRLFFFVSFPVAIIFSQFWRRQFSLVQSLRCVRLFAKPWITAHQASLSITNSRSSLRLNVHRVSDAIQPSHPLLSPSSPAPNPSQQQSLFQWVNSLHEVAKVLEFQLQQHSFQRTPRTDLL